MTVDWQRVLREKGYRLTPQRELVLAAVDDLGHATPDEVLAKVRESSAALNISTVYRSLDLLEELGLVRHTHLTDRAPTYHSTATPAHVHLVCRGCREVLDAEPDDFEPLARTLEDKHGFVADMGHLTVFGRCQDCAGDEDRQIDRDRQIEEDRQIDEDRQGDRAEQSDESRESERTT